MKIILISGGAGYIGCHITDFLQKNGYDYVVYDNLSRRAGDPAELIANYSKARALLN